MTSKLFNLTENLGDKDFFPFMTEKSVLKWIGVAISCVSIIVGPVALYAVVWFEKFGSDKKRTLVNMLFSMTCWTTMAFCVLVQSIETLRYIVGPLTKFVCIAHLYVRYTLVLIVAYFLQAILITRYVVDSCYYQKSLLYHIVTCSNG